MSTKFKPKYKRVAQLKTASDLRSHLAEQDIILDFDEELMVGADAPFQKNIPLLSGKTIGNRLCILPMEGWDGTEDGRPTDFTKRRWRNFAESGAKLLWGCEAVAVRHDGRANPNQLLMNDRNYPEFEKLYQLIIDTHEAKFGTTDDLVVGLQITHSGRFSKPNDNNKGEPQILYNHPYLDEKFGLGDAYPVMADDDIDALIQDFIKAAVKAQRAGFHFVDIKHCHGYLGHEFLTAYDRPGKYGGSLEGRTRFLREVVSGIRKEAPGLEIGVRLSAFDWLPFKKGVDDQGEPQQSTSDSYRYAFGGGDTGLEIDLGECFDFLKLAQSLGIQLVCITAGSPYYNPHIQRPALFPPSDGYQPPEDPLAGVARQIQATAKIKEAFPELVIVGSAYSYLQEWLPNVGQAVLRQGMSDSIGLGRMVLSYPDLPDDILHGRPLQRKKVCRTFSDCTTAPRNGIVSGCWPLVHTTKACLKQKLLKP